MKWTREESDRRRAIDEERRREFHYTVRLTPEQREILRQATLVNRRMLDRSPEHALLDRAFTLIQEQCNDQFAAAFPPFEPYDPPHGPAKKDEGTTSDGRTQVVRRRHLVKCTLFVEVEVPDADEHGCGGPEFSIEENSCPGTGAVGAALRKAMDEADEGSHCWACNLRGKNEIVEGGVVEARDEVAALARVQAEAAALRQAIGVMVPTIIRAYLTVATHQVDQEAATATLVRVERALASDAGRDLLAELEALRGGGHVTALEALARVQAEAAAMRAALEKARTLDLRHDVRVTLPAIMGDCHAALAPGAGRALLAELEALRKVADALPRCSGTVLGGSGGHRRHARDCSRPAKWWHAHDPFAYCDDHMTEFDKTLENYEEAAWHDALTALDKVKP